MTVLREHNIGGGDRLYRKLDKEPNTSLRVLFLLPDAGIIHIEAGIVWPFVLLGIGIAFLLEWKYARRS